MITAAEVLERHPQGCWMFDAAGRQLKHVHACNPDTGEVIMVDWRPTLWQRLTSTLRRSSRWNWLTLRSHVPTRHGFWPAPLHIVPKPHWPGGPVPDGQAHIVGNGEREAFYP